MTAYYNENDPNAAAWLRNLIAAGLIAPGRVDERSITEVRPNDLEGFTQCHFFAGIGVWSYALRLAGWPDSRPVWTGSCPCGPFSDIGAKAEFGDDRHLWPSWLPIIRERGPRVIFGEQVASKDGLAWLDIVHADLESETYTVGAIDSCAAGVGAPHIRQRLFFVAARPVGHPIREGLEGYGRDGDDGDRSRRIRAVEARSAPEAGLPCNGYWRGADWLACSDGKARAAEPGTFPLAHGPSADVVRLRGYGNAIVAPVAAEFIRAFMEFDDREGVK